MRRIIGEEAANATVARNILFLSTVTGDGEVRADDLHRRCVLFACAPSRVRIDAVCAALAPPSGGAGAGGDIEAVALCGYFVAAVVVFRTPDAAETALQGPARRSCHALPPLHVGIEIPGIGPTDVKIMPDLPVVEPCAPPTSPEEEEALPWFEFRDPWAEAPE